MKMNCMRLGQFCIEIYKAFNFDILCVWLVILFVTTVLTLDFVSVFIDEGDGQQAVLH